MDEPQTPGSQSVLLGSVISIKNLLMHLLDRASLLCQLLPGRIFLPFGPF